jgi:hypothetical protein
MSEFNNRVDAQRQVLKAVNAQKSLKEDLLGLTGKAIQRWVTVNGVDHDSTLVRLINSVGDKLFFLANKSQEQISEEYKILSSEIENILNAIKTEIKRAKKV